ERGLNSAVIRFSPGHDTRIAATQFCIQLPDKYSGIQLAEVSNSFKEAVIHISSGKIYVVFAPMADESVLLKQEEALFTLYVSESDRTKPLSINSIEMNYSALSSIAATGDGQIGSVTLSVSEPYEDDQITIHPNPFSDYLWFQVMNSHKELEGRLELFNLMGQRILRKTLVTGMGTSRHFVQINQPLLAGMYIARWTTNEGSQEFKLIK